MTAFHLDTQQQATVAAALRYYRSAGQGEPYNRDDATHALATDGDKVVSLDARGIDELFAYIHRGGKSMTLEEQLLANQTAMLQEVADATDRDMLRDGQRPTTIVVVYDSQDPDREPTVWAPPQVATTWTSLPLNKSQEHGGRFPNTDPADIELLEAGCNARFPDYVQLP